MAVQTHLFSFGDSSAVDTLGAEEEEGGGGRREEREGKRREERRKEGGERGREGI